MVLVVLLVGILALLAAPAFQQTLLEYETDRAAAEVGTYLRYARSLAVAGKPHFVLFDVAANSISMWDTEKLIAAPDPMRKGHDCVLQLGGGKFSHVDLVSADFSGTQKLSFDRLGNASGGGTAVITGGDFTRTLHVTGPGGKVTIE